MHLAYSMPSYGRGTAIQQHLDHMATFRDNGVHFDDVIVVSSGPGYPFGHGVYGGVPGCKRFIHWHSEERLNPGQARNVLTTLYMAVVARLGEESVLVQTDDDCLLAPTDMAILIDKFSKEADKVGLAMPLLKSGFVCQAARRIFLENEVDRARVHAPFRVVSLSPSLIRRIGFYDPFLRFTQDLDYAIRAKAAGFLPTCYDTPLGESPLPEAKYGGHELYRQTSIDDEVQQERAEHMLTYKRYLVQQYPGSFLDKRGNFIWQRALKAAKPEVRRKWARFIPSIVPNVALNHFMLGFVS